MWLGTQTTASTVAEVRILMYPKNTTLQLLSDLRSNTTHVDLSNATTVLNAAYVLKRKFMQRVVQYVVHNETI